MEDAESEKRHPLIVRAAAWLLGLLSIGLVVLIGTWMASFVSWLWGAVVIAAVALSGAGLWVGRRKAFLATMLLAAIVPVTIAMLPFWASLYRHDRLLDRFTENLCFGPIAPNSEHDECGGSVSLTGNGNHCDYEAWIVVSSTLPEDSLLEFYESQSYPSVVGDARLPLSRSDTPSFRFEGGVGLTVEPLESDSGSRAEIRLYDPGHAVEGDIRCT